MAKKTELLVARVSPEFAGRVKAKAKRSGLRVSELIRILLERWLAGSGHEPEDAA